MDSLPPQKPAFRQIIQTAWRHIVAYFLPANTHSLAGDTDITHRLAYGRDRILTIMLRLTSLLGMLGIFSIMGQVIEQRRYGLLALYLGGMILIGVISYLRQISYKSRTILFLSLVYLMGAIDLFHFGIAEDWRLYFSGFTIFTTLFLGWRSGVVALFLSLLTFVTIGWQIAIGHIVPSASLMASPVPTAEVILAFSIVFFMTNGITISAISALLHEFEIAHQNERQATIKLEQRTAELEQSFSREQELARELAFSLEREEALSQLRATIITTVSHEFRTPLTVINNSANLLKDYYGRLTEEKRQEQYDRIHSSIFYLTELLQDVALVERSKKDNLKFQPSPTTFGALCAQLATDLPRETNQPKNLSIHTAGHPESTLVLDYSLLKRVLLSLLSNALKFSDPTSPISLTLSVDKLLTATVVDQGIGILPEDEENVWKLFYRGSNIDNHRGLGLGLFIAQQLVETMSGTITLAANPEGQGAVFTVQLPLSIEY